MARGFKSEDVERADLVDLEGRVIDDSREKSVRVDFDGALVWLPRSEVDVHAGTVTMPRWLAEDRGLA